MTKVQETYKKAEERFKAANEILKPSQTEKRELNDEERTKFGEQFVEGETLKATAQRMEQDEQRFKKLETELAGFKGTTTVTQEERSDGGSDEGVPEVRTMELPAGRMGLKRRFTIPNYREERRAMDRMNRTLQFFCTPGAERRSLQKDLDIAGGLLSPPMEFIADLIVELHDLVWMRQISRVMPPISAAETLGIPTLDQFPSDPDWTGELSIGSEDSTDAGLAFGRRELKPWPLAKFIKVSKTLIRRSTIAVDEVIREQFAYKFGVAQEKGFLTGDGNNKPLGVFTASTNGISTARDVSTGNATTSMTFDGLQNALYSLKAQYRNRNCAWIFHRDAVKQIAGLKDGEGRYLWISNQWVDSLIAGKPQRLLGFPIYESEYAPNTFTTGKYVGILGDFNFYYIVDALVMTLQILVELYAGSNQQGFVARMECDGMPVHEKAFARVKLG